MSKANRLIRTLCIFIFSTMFVFACTFMYSETGRMKDVNKYFYNHNNVEKCYISECDMVVRVVRKKVEVGTSQKVTGVILLDTMGHSKMIDKVEVPETLYDKVHIGDWVNIKVHESKIASITLYETTDWSDKE